MHAITWYTTGCHWMACTCVPGNYEHLCAIKRRASARLLHSKISVPQQCRAPSLVCKVPNIVRRQYLIMVGVCCFPFGSCVCPYDARRVAQWCEVVSWHLRALHICCTFIVDGGCFVTGKGAHVPCRRWLCAMWKLPAWRARLMCCVKGPISLH